MRNRIRLSSAKAHGDFQVDPLPMVQFLSVIDVSPRTTRLVFVSHSGPDTWVAKQIAREIEAHGGTPFLGEAQVDAGADFEEEILEFLQEST